MTNVENDPAFDKWWDTDYLGNTNPYRKDSAAYWAWAGWEAAQSRVDQDEVDIRSRLYQRVHELEDTLNLALKALLDETTNVELINKAIDACDDVLDSFTWPKPSDKGFCKACQGLRCTAKKGCVALDNSCL